LRENKNEAKNPGMTRCIGQLEELDVAGALALRVKVHGKRG
jgi:hypothetical protein